MIAIISALSPIVHLNRYCYVEHDNGSNKYRFSRGENLYKNDLTVSGPISASKIILPAVSEITFYLLYLPNLLSD